MKTPDLTTSELDQLCQPMYYCDRTGNILYHNRAAEKLWGRVPVPGKDKWCGAWKLLNLDDHPVPASDHPVRLAIKAQKAGPGRPLKLVQPDGTVKSIIPCITPAMNAPEKVSGYWVLMLESTAETGTPQGLKADAYRELFEQSEDGLFIFDHEGKYLAANESGCSLLGFSQDELSLLSLYDLMPGVYKGKVPAKLTCLSPGESVELERELMHRTGVSFHAEIKARLLPNGNIRIVIRDISSRKLADEKLIKTIERYDILSRATNDVIWDWDISNHRMYYGEGISRMLGYELSEIREIERWWQQKIHPDDVNRVQRHLSEMFSKKRHDFVLTYRFRAVDDSYRFIYDRGMVMYNAEGKPVRVAGVMQDITYRNEKDTQLARLIFEAQESVRQQIGTELHDNVNQILTGSLMHLAQIRHCDTQKAAELSELIREYIFTAIQELRKLSHRLVPAISSQVSMREMFLDLVQSMNLQHRMEVVVDVQEIIHHPLDVDVQLNLVRMLQEQLTNIVRYAGATKVQVQLTEEKDALRFRILDNGCGFEPDKVKSGIGLSNIRKRIQLMDGEFILNTAVGMGCEMIAVIPLGARQAAA